MGKLQIPANARQKPSVALSQPPSVAATLSSRRDAGRTDASDTLKSLLRPRRKNASSASARPMLIAQNVWERCESPELAAVPRGTRIIPMDKAFYEGFAGRARCNISLFEEHHNVHVTIRDELNDHIKVEIQGDLENLDTASEEIELLRRYRLMFGSTLFHPQPDEDEPDDMDDADDAWSEPLLISNRRRRASSLSTHTPMQSATPKSMSSSASSLRSLRSP